MGRPDHHDPGINQGIPEALQNRGYPVFSQATLHSTRTFWNVCSGEEVREGIIPHPMDVGDVWKHTFSANSANKLWAAKFYRPPSQPDRSRALQLQVRARCTDLHHHRENHRNFGHTVLRVQGYRREQTDRINQASRRNHRLLFEVVSERAQGRRGGDRSQEPEFQGAESGMSNPESSRTDRCGILCQRCGILYAEARFVDF